MEPLTIMLPSPEATGDLATRLARAVRPGDAILLSGMLGAGKSVFSRAFLRAACGDPEMEVPSPTYTLVQAYDAEVAPIAHFDLWRLDGSGGLHELGWDDACEGIVLVEWPDRLEELTPADALRIDLLVTGEETRSARIEGWDDRSVRAELAVWRPV